MRTELRRKMPCIALAVFLLGFLPGGAAAYLDLADARVAKLDNGLTVIVLENHGFPVVSVQMLYKAGARNEITGATGLAHFLEHMAFRSSENFPDTGLVSRVYDAGGEWHGYTWLDQTTYYATVPSPKLDLLLKIEADRMARLDIPAADLDSERGAVLTEMHSYENDPAIVLQDHVLYVSFLAHPYRNNTIGWESDIAKISHAELVDFYQRHYQPGNAVLAVVGDVETADVMRRAQQYFGKMEGRPASPAPHTMEPVQSGERRIRLEGEQDRKYFKIVYRAPAVNSPDYAAFLLLQDMLAAGSGVSFLQNDWGTPARPGSLLSGISEDLTTWFPPSAQDYVFMISGSMPADGNERATELAIEAGIDGLRKQLGEMGPEMTASLEQARQRVMRELTFDLQTTEDAAHQLAFFAGLDALGVLVELGDLLKQVSVEDVRRVLERYLASPKKTVGWSVPIDGGSIASARREAAAPDRAINRAIKWTGSDGTAKASRKTAPPAEFKRLSNGTPVIIQRSMLSPTALLKVIVPSANFSLPAGVARGQPAWGLTSLGFELLPGELEGALAEARHIIHTATPVITFPAADNTDPQALLEGTFRDLLGLSYPNSKPGGPVLLVVSGDIEPAVAFGQLEAAFGDLPAEKWRMPAKMAPLESQELEKQVVFPVAQLRLGYLVQVPGPREKTQAAWQIVLYVLSHGYEGRLGKEAISRRGLVYYIDSAYQTDGTNDWITLSTGVDPGKLPLMKKLLREQLDLLLSQPPSHEEIEAARNHLLGRYVSAAQSNRELSESLTRQWILHGSLQTVDDLESRLKNVTLHDIMEALHAFTRGSVVSIRNPSRNP